METFHRNLVGETSPKPEALKLYPSRYYIIAWFRVLSSRFSLWLKLFNPALKIVQPTCSHWGVPVHRHSFFYDFLSLILYDCPWLFTIEGIRGVTLYNVLLSQNYPKTLPYTYLCRMTPGPTFVFELFGLIPIHRYFRHILTSRINLKKLYEVLYSTFGPKMTLWPSPTRTWVAWPLDLYPHISNFWSFNYL